MNLRAIEEIRRIYEAENERTRVEEIEWALEELQVSQGSSEELRVVDQKEARESELRKNSKLNVFRIMHDASKNIGLQEMIGVERVNKIMIR